MKKSILGILVLTVLMSFKTVDTVTEYKFTLTPEETRDLLYALSKSTAEHLVVKPLEEKLWSQINAQNVADTTKPKK